MNNCNPNISWLSHISKRKLWKPKKETTPVVEMRNIKKNFAAVQALKGVDLVLNHGEVLGLVGDNAAGKSTLMKVLSGAYIPEEGEIFIEGKKATSDRSLACASFGH